MAVVLNPAAGGLGDDAAGRIMKLFAARGQAVAFTLAAPGVSVSDAGAEAVASGVPAVVAAGGDGTVNAVASTLVGGEVPLGILPLGTLNHFARDLGVPLDLEEAVDVIVEGRFKSVDVGEVNGRMFLNNSSIGVYPRLVELRTQYQERGIGKWIAAVWAGLALLRRRPFLGVRIESPEGVLVRRTPFVMIGNNAYRMSGLHAASRDSVNGGRLAVYVMKAERRRDLLRVAWQVLSRGAHDAPELDFLSVVDVTVETKRRDLQVALDGEVVTMHSPLFYRILPGALRVLVK